ncbi:MAG: MBL fold metallo-hydrolase [Weeksellaceae bacterium]|nr:MBL fold metallo-hydrolase [Weeksellaceae bacterium]
MAHTENKLIFLGTGTSQGIPVIGSKHPVCLSQDTKDKRLRSSIYVQYQGQNILIDCGPDFRQQMLRAQLSSIDSVLITHEHNDHIIGMDDLRPILFRSSEEIPIYAEQRVIDDIKTRFPYAFQKEKYPGVPSFSVHTIDTQPFHTASKVEIIPLRVIHGQLPILGYRIGNMAYCTDVSHIPSETLEQLQNLDILILGALRQTPHHSHMTLKQAINYANEIGAKNTYITHIGHEMGFHEQVSKSLKPHVHLSYDGLQLSFSGTEHKNHSKTQHN